MVSEQVHSGETLSITLPEDSRILTTLFQYTYPLTRPDPPSSFSTLKVLILAAQKYMLSPVISSLRPYLLTSIASLSEDQHPSGFGEKHKHALRVFALAHRLGFTAERTAAAHALLRLSSEDLQNWYVDELEDIPAAAYFRLLEYHDRCGHAASVYMLAHALSYSGTEPIRSSPATSPSCLSASKSRHISQESSPNSTSSSSSRRPGAIATRRGHSSTCHVVLDEASDLAWTRFRTQSTPRWWIMYVYKLGIVLRHRPWARVALDVGLRQRAMARAAECECCRTQFLPGFVEYAEGLARDIERVVKKVKLKIE